MTAFRLPGDSIGEWVRQLQSRGIRVAGPVRAGRQLLFAPIDNPEDIVLGAELPAKSPKGVFFPQSEVIMRYKTIDGKTTVEDIKDFAKPTVLLGVHPCDAAAGGILDKVFDGRLKDKFYLERRANTTIVSLGCPGMLDDSCFCTSVGLAPDSRIGADVYTERDNDGSLYVESVTEKGAELLASDSGLFEPTDRRYPAENREPRIDMAVVKSWLDEHFDDEFWREAALKCIGCGTCTFLCPVCHCFDIVDETHQGEGVRRKNWDSCQFSLFTRHASGHNPRPDQSARYRQRIMHKFKYYVDNFDSTLCVGCGRCVRSCPVGMSLLDVLSEIQERASAPSVKS